MRLAATAPTPNPTHQEASCSIDACGLTFELSGRRRQDARPRAVMMHHVPQAWAWWPAVGAPLERGVSEVIGPPAANRPEETPCACDVARWNAAPWKTDAAMVRTARGLAWSWVTSSTLVSRSRVRRLACGHPV